MVLTLLLLLLVTAIAVLRRETFVAEIDTNRDFNVNARGCVEALIDIIKATRNDMLESDNIRVVDMACGKAQWVPAFFKAVEPPIFITSYVGKDDRPHMVGFAAANTKGVAEYTRIDVADPHTHDYPACDVLLCRNLLQYKSFASIEAIIRNIARCDFNIVVLDSYEYGAGNVDTILDQHFFINLEKAPFNMSPGYRVNEHGTNPQKLVFVYTKGQITAYLQSNAFFNKEPDPHHSYHPLGGGNDHDHDHAHAH
jgi:hypothetical protein